MISPEISSENVDFKDVYPKIPKAKNRTGLAVLGSFIATSLAVVFVITYWGSLNNFGLPPVFNRNTALFPPRSDELSETCEDCGLPKEDCAEHNTRQNTSSPESEFPENDRPSHNESMQIICMDCGLPEDECPGHDGKPGTSDVPNIILYQERVSFKPDSAIFLDPETAEAIISEYANNLRELIENSNEDVKVYVVGSVAETWDAKTDSGGSQRLSEQRSLAVLDVLIKYGVPEKSAFAFGMSYKDPWHLDNFVDGMFDEEIAKVNRKVVIVMTGDDAVNAIRTQIICINEPLTMFWYENGVLKTKRFDTLE